MKILLFFVRLVFDASGAEGGGPSYIHEDPASPSVARMGIPCQFRGCFKAGKLNRLKDRVPI